MVKASAWFVAAMVTARGKASRATSVGRSAAREGLSKAHAAPTATTVA